jgi:putative ABC transport system ATP-binding protein
MIELRGVGKDYVRGPETIAALDGVDLTIDRGEYLALVGPSGSGKSTLMNIIGCLDVPTRGSYRLRGIDTAALDDDALAEIRNREIGFIFQSFFLLPRKTALENVVQPLMYREIPHTERIEQAMAALEKVGLNDRSPSPARWQELHCCCSPMSPQATSIRGRQAKYWTCSRS